LIKEIFLMTHVSNEARVDGYLVFNAKYHDANFSRLELLNLLGEQENAYGTLRGLRASQSFK
tara:strand:- start:4594 stop:4779 length:186 start_codon:yes stop_codon:yes gene_type:complete